MATILATVVPHLHSDVVYLIDGVAHRGPQAVVDGYRNGSALADLGAAGERQAHRR
jgi:hypothetical protein